VLRSRHLPRDGTDHRGRQVTVPLQRRAPRPDRRDYQAFEQTIAADYDAQCAVERELVLRLASLLWRLRRATTMETGLFEIQAEQLDESRRPRPMPPAGRKVFYSLLGHANRPDAEQQRVALPAAVGTGKAGEWPPQAVEVEPGPGRELARCFLRRLIETD
jgi:hypothetical protein